MNWKLFCKSAKYFTVLFCYIIFVLIYIFRHYVIFSWIRGHSMSKICKRIVSAPSRDVHASVRPRKDVLNKNIKPYRWEMTKIAYRHCSVHQSPVMYFFEGNKLEDLLAIFCDILEWNKNIHTLFFSQKTKNIWLIHNHWNKTWAETCKGPKMYTFRLYPSIFRFANSKEFWRIFVNTPRWFTEFVNVFWTRGCRIIVTKER